ncbi:hypothetical protein [Arachidicoccus sp.]|uniref:hypothetical protein n=1 Tax=Arachidicoccus sp. TaxID=1872624 RepID=UPI003D25ADED
MSEKRVSVLWQVSLTTACLFYFFEAIYFDSTHLPYRASGVAIRLSRIRNACEGGTPSTPDWHTPIEKL